ncbi:MAG: glycosyltransferase family 9 protein [Betaproteobacteria bacterium]|nr:glycosyltransferase family 9 protein [Betaproteobacteria bacterium]
MSEPRSLLVVRRDNIGDLVCTTPLLTALRRRFPQAWLGALVNSYNAPVLAGNDDLDAAIAYTKLKHLEPGKSALGALGARLASFWKLRRQGLDCVLLATPDFSPRMLHLARWLGAKEVAGFSDGSAASRALDRSVPLAGLEGRHEVERVFALAALFDIAGEIPPLKVVPDATEIEHVRALLAPQPAPRIAVHVSARRPAQRWPAERFAELIRRLHERRGASSLLLWSPGPAHHPRHPGDDDKANEIVARVGRAAPLVAYPTYRLAELIGALAACDAVVCADGGALHLAAALGKPIAALFGDSPPERWRPWKLPHEVLRPESRDVRDLAVDEVAAALARLLAPTGT